LLLASPFLADILGQPWGDAIFSQTFDSGVGSWKVVGITTEAISQNGATANYTSSATPTYHSSGGNTGGFISASDPYAPTFGIDGVVTNTRAPTGMETDFYSFDAGSDFNGVWPTRAYEGVIQFDYRLNISADLAASAITPGNIYLKGSLPSYNISYAWPASQPLPTSSWQTMTIYLSEQAGWKTYSASNTGSTPTQSTFTNTLKNVARLSIPGDWLQTTAFGGNILDVAQIDNVFVRQGKKLELPFRTF
jgi:hypothetical protein